MTNNFGRFSENPQYMYKDMIVLLKVRHRKSEQLNDIALKQKWTNGDRLFLRHSQSEQLPEY